MTKNNFYVVLTSYIAIGLNYRVFRSFLFGPRVINHGITKKLSEVKYRLLGAILNNRPL